MFPPAPDLGYIIRNAMRLRAWTTPFLVALTAVLPTLVSLCELRCDTPVWAATDADASPGCSGHGADKSEQAPPGNPFDSRHDCGGHALLAKSGGAGFDLRLARALVGLAVATGVPDPAREALSQAGALSESTDLSPPFARTPDVLRL